MSNKHKKSESENYENGYELKNIENINENMITSHKNENLKFNKNNKTKTNICNYIIILILAIIFLLILKQYQIFKSKDKTYTSKILILEQSINKLINENKILKESLNNVLETIKLNENEIKNLQNKNIIFENEIELIKETVFVKYFKNSSIVYSKQEENYLIDLISEKVKIKSVKLLYKRSIDNNTKFFEKCANKGITITLIKTKTFRRFGGFTKVNWPNYFGEFYGTDNDAFLFSFDTKRHYPINNPQRAIRAYKEYNFIAFGNTGSPGGLWISIDGRYSSGEDEWQSNVYKGFNSKNEITGEDRFQLEELEVFQIEIY